MPALGLSNKLTDDTGDVPFIGNSEEDRNTLVAPMVLTCLFQFVPNSSVFLLSKHFLCLTHWLLFSLFFGVIVIVSLVLFVSIKT